MRTDEPVCRREHGTWPRLEERRSWMQQRVDGDGRNNLSSVAVWVKKGTRELRASASRT